MKVLAIKSFCQAFYLVVMSLFTDADLRCPVSPPIRQTMLTVALLPSGVGPGSILRLRSSDTLKDRRCPSTAASTTLSPQTARKASTEKSTFLRNSFRYNLRDCVDRGFSCGSMPSVGRSGVTTDVSFWYLML